MVETEYHLPPEYSYSYTPDHILMEVFSYIPWKVQLLFVDKKFNNLYRETLAKQENPLSFSEFNIDYHVKFDSYYKVKIPKTTTKNSKEKTITIRFRFFNGYFDFAPLSLTSIGSFNSALKDMIDTNNTMVEDEHGYSMLYYRIINTSSERFFSILNIYGFNTNYSELPPPKFRTTRMRMIVGYGPSSISLSVNEKIFSNDTHAN